ncbi:MAG: DUF4433 domain-containing protein [Planctomyces sp.]
MPPERRSLAPFPRPEQRCPEKLVTSSLQPSGESQKTWLRLSEAKPRWVHSWFQTTGFQGAFTPHPQPHSPSSKLFLIARGNNQDLAYRQGQEPILHLEADLRETVAWANRQQVRWAFTLSNAGTRYFEDRCDLQYLSEIDWRAVEATDWRSCKEGKQAEFLIEQRFPWELVSRIGVKTALVQQQVTDVLKNASHRPTVEVQLNWYY